MKPAPLHELPPGYAQAARVVLTDSRLLLRLNLLSLLPLVLMIIWLAVWWNVVSQGRAPEPQPDIPWLLASIIVFIVVLPLHEFLHGVAITYLGHRVRYGAKLSKGVLYATAENALFRRNEYVIVALAPLVGITLLVMLLMLFIPAWLAFYAGLAAAVNAGGAIGDMWATGVVLHYPPSALVRDEADSFTIYALEAAGSSTQNTEPPSVG